MRRKTKAERDEEADEAKRAAVAERLAAAEADPLFKGASKRQKSEDLWSISWKISMCLAPASPVLPSFCFGRARKKK